MGRAVPARAPGRSVPHTRFAQAFNAPFWTRSFAIMSGTPPRWSSQGKYSYQLRQPVSDGARCSYSRGQAEMLMETLLRAVDLRSVGDRRSYRAVRHSQDAGLLLSPSPHPDCSDRCRARTVPAGSRGRPNRHDPRLALVTATSPRPDPRDPVFEGQIGPWLRRVGLSSLIQLPVGFAGKMSVMSRSRLSC